MPKQLKDKSAHLQELEAVFERRTRRFSPFDILGLRSTEQDMGVSPVEGNDPPTLRGVDTTHPHDPPTPMEEGGTALPGEEIHPRVVGSLGSTTTQYSDPPTHRGVDT